MTEGLPPGLSAVGPRASNYQRPPTSEGIRRRCLLWGWAAAMLLVTTPAFPGTNAGFTASVEGPAQITNPQVGDEISIDIRVAGTVEVRQIRVLCRYQTEFFEFVGAFAGDHPAGMLFFAESPVDDGGGFAIAGGGGAVLQGASDTSGAGVVTTVTFRVLQEVGEEEERFLSIVSVLVATSSDDVDELTFADGVMGVRLVRRFVNRIFNVDVKRRHDGVTLTWQSRFAGIDDTLRYRISGASEWQTAVSPLAQSGAAGRPPPAGCGNRRGRG